MNDDVAPSRTFVLFVLAGTTYAIPSEAILQIEMVEAITPVPNAAEFVEGIVLSRGHVIPAINLRQRFGFERLAHDARTRLVVVSRNGRVVGLVVDSAREFVSLGSDSIQPPPEELAETSGKYLQSIARIDNRLVLILDVDAILDFADTSTLPAQPA